MPRRSTIVPSYSEVSRTNKIVRPTGLRLSPREDYRSITEKKVAAEDAAKAGMGKRASSQRQKRESTAEINSTQPSETIKSQGKSKVTKGLEASEATPVRSNKPGAKRKVGSEGIPKGEDKGVKRQKTKGDKENESLPLATRTPIQTLKRAVYIGAHVSGVGGVHNTITNALNIGGNSFALFLKSHRKWASPPLAPDIRDQFRAFCGEHKYDAAKHILPHGSYLVNLAQADPEKAEQSYNCFLDDLQRCEALGIELYNFHPGNTGPHPRAEAIARIAANLNKAHKVTTSVVTVLENMAGTGNTIGSTFEDLRDIIALIEDKSRVGICIDTCHCFAAGYDLRSPTAFQATMANLSSIVGLRYVKALHLNDSKAPFGSRRDLHANIGTGFLGLRAFHNVVNYAPFQNLPMVLETPIERAAGPEEPAGKGAKGGKGVVEDTAIWAAEIKLIEGLIGADPDSDAFHAEECRLQALGTDDRLKFQGQADKREQRTLDAMFKKERKEEND